MPFSVRVSFAIPLSLFLFSLVGCGEKTVVSQSSTKSEQSQACIECHASSTSPGTGALIESEWRASLHNIKNGAGCADCHEPQNHPNYYCGTCHNGSQLVGADEIQRNPDRTGKCLKCHNGFNTIDPTGYDLGFHGSEVNGVASNLLNYAGIPMNTQRAHFNNITSLVNEAYPASYLTSKVLFKKGASEGNCRKCHNPHDTTTAIQYNRDYSRSAHGMTAGIPENFYNQTRFLGRLEYDFKMTGTAKAAKDAMTDPNSGDYDSCSRCHTTTGYINFVNSGFSNLNIFGQIGEIRSVSDLYQAANNSAHALNSKYSGKFNIYRGKISPDISKEVTACNACHDNNNESAYGFKLRRVPQYTAYYNIAPNTLVKKSRMPGGDGSGKITNFGLKYPDVGASNMCISCHTGRTVGINLKMMDARQMNYTSGGQGKIDAHYRAAAQLVFRPTFNGRDIGGAGFEFYSSGSSKLQNYTNVQFSHDIIGTTTTNPNMFAPAASKDEGHKGLAADSRGYGPCVGCHMNLKDDKKASQTSHTFLPVNRDASATYYANNANPSEPISGTVSKSCAACHTENGAIEWDESGADPATGIVSNLLNIQKIQYQAALKAYARILAFTGNLSASRSWTSVPSPTDWYGARGNASNLQPWLRTATAANRAEPTQMTLKDGSKVNGLPYYVSDGNGVPLNLFEDPILGTSFKLRNATYTIGAFSNYNLLSKDPGGFVHNRRYAKRLIFDSIDWLDDGKLNKSVCDPTVRYWNNVKGRQYMSLNTYGTNGLAGVNDYFKYSTTDLTADEIKQASYYICESIARTYYKATDASVINGTNSVGDIKAYTSDHRPAP